MKTETTHCLPAVFFCMAVCLTPVTWAQTVRKPAARTIDYDAEARARIATFIKPDEITVELFADASQTKNPGAICFDYQGRLYIAELHRWRNGVEDIRYEQRLLLQDLAAVTNRDRLEMYQSDQIARPLDYYRAYEDLIRVVEDRNGDGRADFSRVWADGFNQVLDGPGIGLLASRDGSIYYTNIPHLWRLQDTNGNGTADEKESLQDGFGVRISFSGHDMHGLVQGPDGRIYWSIGDRGYTFTTKEGRHYSRPTEGAVFRADPDGSNIEEYYRGLRNPQELAFDQYGNLFTCDNDADSWDTGRLVYIMEGGDSGWNHGHQALMNFKEQLKLRNPSYEHPGQGKALMNPWTTEGIWDPDQTHRPEFALPPVAKVSWGPSGLVYNYGQTAIPDRYQNHFFVCNFGGAAGDLEAFSVKPRGAGFELDHHEPRFMVGLGNTDVEFGPDGKMYLCCFNNNGWFKEDIGNIYTLFDETKINSEGVKLSRELLGMDLSRADDDDLAGMMVFDDMRVRQRAQFEIVERNNKELLSAAMDHGVGIGRLHGVWGMGQLARKDPALYEHHIKLLKDPDAAVRAECARILSDSRLESSGQALLGLLGDPSPKVVALAAIGVGKCRIPQAIPKLMEILQANNNEDLFLRHACIQGLWYLNEKEKMLKYLEHESSAVRLALALTLRKLEDPRLYYFLGDPDETIRHCAIRAINDLNLPTAGKFLAAHIEKYIDQAAGFRMPQTGDPASPPASNLPQPHQDWIIQHRLINANFREGTLDDARRLIRYAAASHLPAIMREQALDALAEWSRPSPVDSTVGAYRPLDAVKRQEIRPAISEGMDEVFASARGDLLAKAASLALQYRAQVPEDLLVALVQDTKATVTARTGALQGLASQKPDALEALWSNLFSDTNPKIRGAASEVLLRLDLKKGLPKTLLMAESDDFRDRQFAFRNLAKLPIPEAGEFFVRRMEKIEEETPGAVLDLLEGAASRSEADVQKALERYSSDKAVGTMASFQPCLDGGDPEKGKEIFRTHAAAQCAKCHSIDRDGGDAGPDLTLIGQRGDAYYILESLIEPNKVVVPGYGPTLVNLYDGSTLAGPLIREDENAIELRLTDPITRKQQNRIFAKKDLRGITHPVSAMPTMGYILKKTEIRDLVAYLSSLKGNPEEPGKNHD